MTDPRPILVAEAVVASLKTKTDWDQPFTPEAEYLPTFETAELEDVKVSAVGTTVVGTRADRRGFNHDVTVEIGVQKHIGPPSTTEQDKQAIRALCGLVTQIADFCEANATTLGGLGWSVSTVAIDPLYDPAELEKRRIFTGVVIVVLHKY